MCCFVVSRCLVQYVVCIADGVPRVVTGSCVCVADLYNTKEVLTTLNKGCAGTAGSGVSFIFFFVWCVLINCW